MQYQGTERETSRSSPNLRDGNDGFDCFLLVTKYGCRFTAEDAQALKMLEQLLGKEAYDNMILVLTHGDQAEREAEQNGEEVEETLNRWLKILPDWFQKFIAAINNSVFNQQLLTSRQRTGRV